MLKRKSKQQRSGIGNLDGGEGRGVPMDGAEEDIELIDGDGDDEMIWEDSDPADRRRDPLRR
ncbi:MAG: hypothetical protein M3Q69_12175 [Acidobacteriota bacterium]|nr:hypothetical protein [Acidobacteriota bacterium]